MTRRFTCVASLSLTSAVSVSVAAGRPNDVLHVADDVDAIDVIIASCAAEAFTLLYRQSRGVLEKTLNAFVRWRAA